MTGITMLIASERFHAARLLERMNSPLEIHEVRLRGLGGRAVCGVPGTGASAARRLPGRRGSVFAVGGAG